ncbi:hypothetical protein [Phycicoccus ginsengisoli]
MDERPSRVGAREIGLVSRRTVNLGAAWSVPVVLAAVAAPADTGSPNPVGPGEPPSAVLGTKTATKGTSVDNNRAVTFTLTFTGVVGTNAVAIVGIDKGGPWKTVPSPAVDVTAKSPSATFILTRPDNNANVSSVTVTYSVNGKLLTTMVDIVL